MSHKHNQFEQIMGVVSDFSDRRLVIAEADEGVAVPLQQAILQEGLHIVVTYSYRQLKSLLSLQKVDLLLLGTLKDASCFEVFREFRQEYPSLPVVLLTQERSSEGFKRWAYSRGITAVVSSHLDDFGVLQAVVYNTLQGAVPESLQGPITTIQVDNAASEALTTQQVIPALQQLSEASVAYFGSLSIANYWCKSYKAVVEFHPVLQQWRVDALGNFSTNRSEDRPLTAAEMAGLRDWVQAFLQECQRIIVDFPQLLAEVPFSPAVSELITSATG